ncbi:CBS domain-containing protein [Acidocella sp. KAb 2-4]|uniref:CBS domain-containing protein n=1 Tax=Acidocella sp. KAb 2-4 TaxID=2885158 RepID=UPI001D05F263|nr:CBS domain-containing protein [Acidocella sp. KAb 2-4]MCB5943154.1 CBS domain-containing protein [Acidocella sp. KAb 2-4]
MKVSELMSRNTISVLPGTTVADAARIMLSNRVTGLPVLDEKGALVGIVSEGDLLRRAEIGTDGKQAGWLRALLMPASVASDYVTTHARHVSGVMTHNPVFVTPDTPLDEVAQLMIRKHIKRLPVLDAGQLVGMISRSDLLRLLARKLIETPVETTDEAISAYIKAELDKARWAPKSGLRVSVQDKVVTLDGTIFSDEERQAVIVIAENAPGVKEVKDNLIFVDPGSGLAFPPGD